MLTTAVFELVQQFYHATEIGSGVQRGANGAPAPGIQGQGASKEWNYKNANAVAR